MSMDVAAESNVLDVKHPIPDLAILFQGRDIEEEKSNLKILTIRVINDGDANIHEDDFDNKIPFGLQIDGGRVIRAQVVGGNSPYLVQNVHPQVEGGNQIILDKVIFDRQKFVSLEILVLHAKTSILKLTPIGKIAGLEQISVTDSFQERDQPSVLRQAFSGQTPIQIVRAIAYSFLSLIVVVLAGFLIAGISSIPSRWRKRRRRRFANLISPEKDSKRESKRKAIEQIYIERGFVGLKRVEKLLSDGVKLKRELRFYRGDPMPAVDQDLSNDQFVMVGHGFDSRMSILAPLLSANLITLEQEELHIDSEVRSLLNNYIKHLKDAKQLHDKDQ